MMHLAVTLLLLLKILLDRRVILLCARNVSVLQVLRQRCERLGDRVSTASLCGRTCTARRVRKIL